MYTCHIYWRTKHLNHNVLLPKCGLVLHVIGHSRSSVCQKIMVKEGELFLCLGWLKYLLKSNAASTATYNALRDNVAELAETTCRIKDIEA